MTLPAATSAGVPALSVRDLRKTYDGRIEALKGVQVKQVELQNQYKRECLELEKKVRRRCPIFLSVSLWGKRRRDGRDLAPGRGRFSGDLIVFSADGFDRRMPYRMSDRRVRRAWRRNAFSSMARMQGPLRSDAPALTLYCLMHFSDG